MVVICAALLAVAAWFMSAEEHSSPTAVGSGLGEPLRVDSSKIQSPYVPRMSYGNRTALDSNRPLVDTMYGLGADDSLAVDATPAAVIRLQVLNGCGVKGLAKLVAPGLRAKGFDVREVSNAGSFGYPHSLVYDRLGMIENALAVAESLGIEPAQVSTEIARNLVDIDVTLIVGADFRNLRMQAPDGTRR